MTRRLTAKAAAMGLILSQSISGLSAGNSGQATRDSMLLGMHFLHNRTDCNTKPDSRDVTPAWADYVGFMPEDLRYMSYADFWHWWYEFERYKGDEKGLAAMDRIIDDCLAHGMKVKIDLAWSTWYTNDWDWEVKPLSPVGPGDLDDWVHLCDLLGRRFRGRLALWMLQGEANNLEHYWQGASMEHVSEVYKLGYRAFKRVDPGVLISIAGASPSVPKDALDEWVRVHATNCKGMYDDVPMNFFADCADPYKGIANYLHSIRGILDKLGQKHVEIGSGESSVQWAETSQTITKNPPRTLDGQDPETMPLCELKQAWRLNQSLGVFFSEGNNKFVMWGTEYAPGLGWAWRWGFRKYQDWWGVWQDEFRVPGTNIVFGNVLADGTKIDLRPGWTSPPTDPFHPMWEVYKYWSQLCPPASEAVRIPVSARKLSGKPYIAASYHRGTDRCVALVQSDSTSSAALSIDLKATGWPDGAELSVTMRNESIDYAEGSRRVNWEKPFAAEAAKGKVSIDVPKGAGFTTITIEQAKPAMDAEFVEEVFPERSPCGQPVEGLVIIRNTGSTKWKKDRAVLMETLPKGFSWKLQKDVAPGELATVRVKLPVREEPGYYSHIVRMRDGKKWFGPAVCMSYRTADTTAPRKLVAFRESGHIRLKWFAPESAEAVDHYDVYRADGFERPFKKLKSVKATEMVDEPPAKDRAYYYRVVAVNGRGKASRPSNEDNAKALSQPRIYDAEIVRHTIPAEAQLGQAVKAEVTVKNTGTKEWDMTRPDEISFSLDTLQLWGSQDETILPRIAISRKTSIRPGESVKLTVPFAAPSTGRHENHWVVSVDVVGKGKAWFGTPLLVETDVKPRQTAAEK